MADRRSVRLSRDCHVVHRYGLKWVERWRFETWNEPDHGDFCDVNMTLSGYLNYFDASQLGLLSVSPSLRLGGAGGSCRPPHFLRYCLGLMDHVVNGVNSINSWILRSLERSE